MSFRLTIRVFFLITILILSHNLRGQFSLTGKVADGQDNQPLTGAHIFLYTAPDTLIDITITSTDGTFLFKNLPNNRYMLEISFVGYEHIQKRYIIQNDNLNIGTIYLESRKNPIDEVEIVENVKTATLIGDTIQFNADAYKTMPDASATDLAKKLPGVVIEDNKVQAQGEDVKEVLVDGKPFFGYDPSTALNTLPAEIVDKIQIFDKESDQAEFTGFSTGETSKTMNIITRARMQNGSFGKVTVGYNLDNRYLINGNYNIFNGDQRISFIAQSNNINQQNFAIEDLLGVIAGGTRRTPMGGRGRAGGRGFGIGGAGSVGDFIVPGQQGITTTHAGGINYSDQWGEKFEATASYFFNIGDNVSEQKVYREYLLAADSGQIYNESSSSDSRNINHRFSGKIEYKIDDNNSILIRPRFSFQRNKGKSGFTGETLLDNNILNDIDNSSHSKLEAWSMGNTFLFRHKFDKKGRTFSINLGNSLAQNKGDKYLLNTTRYFTPIKEFDLLDQNSLLNTDGWSVNSSMVYTEPAGENGLLQLSYWLGYQDNESDQETWNFDQETNSYILLDTLLSNSFDNNYITHRMGPSWQYRKGLFTFNAGMNYQYASLQNSQYFPAEFELENSYNNILFNGMIRLGKTRLKSLSLRYNSSTDNPSISELQDVIDNSDPLQVKSGNPELDQSHAHRLFLRYSNMKPENSRVFFVMLSAEFRQKYIGNQTVFAKEDILLENGYLLKKGTQLTRPVNLDGYKNLRSFITMGVPINPLKINLNFNLSGNYSRRPGLIDELVNYSDTWMGGLGIMISSNISEKLDFSLFSQSGYNLTTYSMNNEQNTSYFNQSTRFNFKWVLLNDLVLETTANHQYFNGLSSSLDQNYFILNAAIGEKIFKNKLGEIKLSVYDLLNQNQSLHRNVSEIYIEDTETLILQRLFIITFVYNIRNFNGELPETPAWRPGPGRRNWRRD